MSLYNPALSEALLAIIVEQKQQINEYQLIGILQSPPYEYFAPDALSDPLALFQCHFALFHHLYLLQGYCIDQRIGLLSIHGTRISLIDFNQDHLSMLEHDPLRTYYLDEANFGQTDKEDVDELINSFWEKMAKGYLFTDEQKTHSLEILNLEEPFTLRELKHRYRMKQHIHHPDKGGCEQVSQKLLNAYQLLKRIALP